MNGRLDTWWLTAATLAVLLCTLEAYAHPSACSLPARKTPALTHDFIFIGTATRVSVPRHPGVGCEITLTIEGEVAPTLAHLQRHSAELRVPLRHSCKRYEPYVGLRASWGLTAPTSGVVWELGALRFDDPRVLAGFLSRLTEEESRDTGIQTIIRYALEELDLSTIVIGRAHGVQPMCNGAFHAYDLEIETYLIGDGPHDVRVVTADGECSYGPGGRMAGTRVLAPIPTQKLPTEGQRILVPLNYAALQDAMVHTTLSFLDTDTVASRALTDALIGERRSNQRLKLTDPSWHAPGGGNRTAQVHYLRRL